MSKTIAVFLDVDDLLVEFQPYVMQVVNATFQSSLPLDYKPNHWDWREILPAGMTDRELMRNIIPCDWPLRLEATSYAAQFTQNIAAMGVQVVLITKLEQSKQVLRLKNLAKNGIYYDEIYFCDPEHNKSDFVNSCLDRFSSDYWFFADDNAKNCTDVAENCYARENVWVYSLKYPYNSESFENSQIRFRESPLEIFLSIQEKISELLED
jgi:hypothetical protein